MMSRKSPAAAILTAEETKVTEIVVKRLDQHRRSKMTTAEYLGKIMVFGQLFK
jgi:hypothetical protein